MRLLPHRYPFLLLDRIVEFEPGRRVVGIKNVTINEPFFLGHFPDYPIMPGVLISEALAQAGGFLALKAMGEKGKIAFFAGVDNCKFRRPVVPGDQLQPQCTASGRQGAGARSGAHGIVESHAGTGGGPRVYSCGWIGAPPQDLKYRGEETWVEIG